MLRFFIFSLFTTCLFANSAYLEKFSNPKPCLTCHKEQATDWGTTWHSKSHYDSNPLYAAVVDYISLSNYESKDATLVKCAQCHNPKMTIKTIEDKTSYDLANALHLETSQIKDVANSVEDERIKSGISCYICHSVDKLHESNNMKMRGFEAVEWNTKGVILGPFEDDGRAGYHKSEQRDHFVNSNKLCMACHFGGVNDNGVKLYATGEEFMQSGSTEKCADCHMSSSRKEIIAPMIVREGIRPKIRDIRSHLFASARNSNIMKDTLSFKVTDLGSKVDVEVENLTPHNAPSGFGDRSIEIDVIFKYNGTDIQRGKIILGATFADKKGVETLPYLATSIKGDSRLKPYEKKKFTLDKPKGVNAVNIEANYRLISEKMAKMIELKDPIFLKKYPVGTFTTELK
ncbi:MAG: multiheme c-type cytochrome [Campylobacteraceae bacterium]